MHTGLNYIAIFEGYYVKAVKQQLGCPQRIRADCGTENSVIEQLQIFLRSQSNDIYAGNKSFIYGKSTANQRIECFWGMLRRQCIQYWMNIFSRLKDEGDFSSSVLDRYLIQFCFMDAVQVKYCNVIKIHGTLIVTINLIW